MNKTCPQVYIPTRALIYCAQLLRISLSRGLTKLVLPLPENGSRTAFRNVMLHQKLYNGQIIFISVINQLDAQHFLFHNKFYFMPLHVSSTRAHHQEVKIALHSLWYHHTYRCDDKHMCSQSTNCITFRCN